jgi:hypothetical protein
MSQKAPSHPVLERGMSNNTTVGDQDRGAEVHISTGGRLLTLCRRGTSALPWSALFATVEHAAARRIAHRCYARHVWDALLKGGMNLRMVVTIDGRQWHSY